MLKESFLKKLTHEHLDALLQDRLSDSKRLKRALPLIDRKMIDYPNWKAVCSMSGMPLTLPDIKEEASAWLEESEEEIKQLEDYLSVKIVPQKLRAIQMELKL